MSSVATPVLEDIKALQRAMSSLPQAELETKHHFIEGVYLRELFRPKGTTIVGKVHKKEHFYIVLSGKVTIVGDGYRETVKAPRILISAPGTKRAVYAHKDSICITVHRTDSQDLAEIEQELIEDDPTALFGPGNVLKVLEDLS